MAGQRAAYATLLVALVAGCVTSGSEAGRAAAAAVAADAGLLHETRPAGGFFIDTWFRPSQPWSGAGKRRILRVYIEGDGRAWRSRTQVSSDPTPVNPIGLRLAAADPFPDDVLYLARPCQFAGSRSAACEPSVWSFARFSQATVDALNAIIDEVREARGSDTIVLIGYSGGGVVAALIAARRPDVANLVTVAAPLNHLAWTDHHRVSPLRESLSPMDFLAALRHVPQTHFIGQSDTNVPPAIVVSYLDALAAGTTAQLRTVAGFDHACCWSARWAQLVRQAMPAPVSPAVQTETHR